MPRNTEWIKQILENNKSKSFVKRMYAENPAFLSLGNGEHATHRMAWSQIGNQYVVYPTVLDTGNGLQAFDPKDALGHVLKTNNYIALDNPDDADYLSRNYKQVLTNPIFK